MNVALLPRLSALGVSFVLEGAVGNQLSPSASRAIVAQRVAMLSYATTGGTKDPNAIIAIGESVRDIARAAGFPGDNSAAAHARFDRTAAIYLAQLPEISTGEGLRDDMWAYAATVVVPDVVAWRFPGRPVERFRGGVRNAIQRLWIRGVVLDRGATHPQRWALIEALKEDAAVQIFERPAIFGNPRLARALAEGYVVAASKTNQAMEAVMRRAAKVFRLRNEVYDLGALSQEALDAVVSECFALARS